MATRRKKSATSEPHVHSIGKTLRLRSAGQCPGEHPAASCDRCPSVDECVVARFNPKA